MTTRHVLIIVPLAALLGIGAALSFYFLADRSSSKLPAFRLELAKQGAGGSATNHSPTTNTQRKAKELRDARRLRAIRRARAALAEARAQAAAAATFGATQQRSRPANTIEAVSAPVQAQPAPTPVSRPAPQPAPQPAPAPRRSGGGGGGGSFDDSG
jgi:hypothetical protein